MQFRSREFQKYIQEKSIEHERIAVNTPAAEKEDNITLQEQE